MSNRNSSKSQIFLMEFICVVMFFAICVALCINVFVKADSTSKEGRELNESLLLAQSMAENIKAMDNPNHDNIVIAVDKINQEIQNKYIVKVKDKVIEDILEADIYIYNMKSMKTEVCSLTMKKYLPREVQDAD